MVIALFLLLVYRHRTAAELAPWFTLCTLEILVEAVIFSLLI